MPGPLKRYHSLVNSYIFRYWLLSIVFVQGETNLVGFVQLVVHVSEDVNKTAQCCSILVVFEVIEKRAGQVVYLAHSVRVYLLVVVSEQALNRLEKSTFDPRIELVAFPENHGQ